MTNENKNEKPFWTLYRVRWDFLTSLCSSVPANPEMRKGWLDGRKGKALPPGGKTIAEIQEEVFETIADAPDRDAEEAKSLLVFQRVDGNLVMRAATVRAHLKDCARIISREHVGKIKGQLSFATRLINCVYLDELQYWIPVTDRDGKPFTAPHGVREKAVHTWNGNALKAFEFVNGARMDFTLKVLGGNIKREDLETVFMYGGVHGYAGERGDGEGKYRFKIHEGE